MLPAWRAYPLPGDAHFLNDSFNMPVPPSRAGGGKHSALVRRNDHLRIGMFRQYRLRYRLAVVGAIVYEHFTRCRDLIEQIRHGCRVAHMRRHQFARENLMMFVYPQVQLAPSAPGGDVMFFMVPFVFSVYLEPVESTMTKLRGSRNLLKACFGKPILRLEMQLKSGMLISTFRERASEFMKPSVCRNAR